MSSLDESVGKFNVSQADFLLYKKENRIYAVDNTWWQRFVSWIRFDRSYDFLEIIQDAAWREKGSVTSFL